MSFLKKEIITVLECCDCSLKCNIEYADVKNVTQEDLDRLAELCQMHNIDPTLYPSFYNLNVNTVFDL